MKVLQRLAVLALFFLTGTTCFAQITLNSLTDPTPGLSPNIAQVGGGSFTVQLKGAGFSANSAARLGGAAVSTTFQDANTLTATVPAALIKTLGQQDVTVVDGTSASNALPLIVTAHGDANGNGSINIADALTIARSVGGLSKPLVPAPIADLNLSDAVNIGDALTAALFAGGLKNNLEDRKSTRLNSSHSDRSRMPSSA